MESKNKCLLQGYTNKSKKQNIVLRELFSYNYKDNNNS